MSGVAYRVDADLVGHDVHHAEIVDGHAYFVDRFDAPGARAVVVKVDRSNSESSHKRWSTRVAKEFGVPPFMVDAVDVADVPASIRPDPPRRLTKSERLLAGAEHIDNMAQLSIPVFERSGRSRHDVGHDPEGMKVLGEKVKADAERFARGWYRLQ